MRSFLIVLLVVVLSCSTTGETLEPMVEWNTLNFAFPYGSTYQQLYRPDLTVPTGLEIGWRRLFINIPRLRDGVPATLAYVPRTNELQTNPQLQAYPSWEWHTAGVGDLNCSRLISTYRSRIDRCNRLWVLDAGVVTSIDDFRPVCNPKFMIFDLATDRLVRQYDFPRQSLRPNSLLTNFVFDETASSGCDDVTIYITDTAGPGIVIYDAAQDTSRRFVHPTMFPHPDYSQHVIGDDQFQFMDGVIGIGFSQRTNTIFYSPLATNRLYSVTTPSLRGSSSDDAVPVTLVGRKSSQSIALTVDTRDDSIVFAPLTETAIASFNPQTNSQRVLAKDSEKLQFTADVRNAPRDRNQLWALSTRFQKYFLKNLNPQDINIRIMRLRTEEPASLVPRFRSFPYNPFAFGALNFYNNTLGF